MRVQLTRRSARDERGAIALVTAVMTTSLVVISGFALDFGLAYNSKQRLQTAADSAALAAAGVYADAPGRTCGDLAGDEALRGEAEAAASSYRLANRGASAGSALVVACNADGELELSTEATASTPSVFGEMVTGASEITTSRVATAVVDVPPGARHVRPLMLCSADIPPVTGPPAVVEIKPPGQAHTGATCAEAESPGDWWFITCDVGGTSTGGNKGIGIAHGCDDEISVVEPQNEMSPEALSDSLTFNCSDGALATSSCLHGDTGNSSLITPEANAAFAGILGETVVFPVFCSEPACSPDTVSGSGSTVRYPVYKLASAVVCGYHIYDKSSAASASGDCAGNSYDQAYVESKPKGEVYLYLKFVSVRSSDVTDKASCALGSACDGGLRRVHLVE